MNVLCILLERISLYPNSTVLAMENLNGALDLALGWESFNVLSGLLLTQRRCTAEHLGYQNLFVSAYGKKGNKHISHTIYNKYYFH